ncbi:MAG: LysE family transporter [Hyphomicrobiales bacterium]|nr:LysE family transporter [Hyphomicrobiales bacterium]
MHELISFAILWFFMAGAIGPNALISIDSSIQYGWPRALMVPLGITAASIIYGFLSITVLAYLLEIAPGMFKLIIVLGSLYLLYLGYKILTRPALEEGSATKSIKNNKLMFLGFTTSLSNPKAALVYLSVLPGMAHSENIDPVILIVTACTIVFFIYSAYSWFANLFRNFIIGFPRRQKLMDILACLSFSLIAVKNIYYVVMEKALT